MKTTNETILPADVQTALNTNTLAQDRFAQLPPSHQREYLKHIDEAKKPETRARRIASMLAHLTE